MGWSNLGYWNQGYSNLGYSNRGCSNPDWIRDSTCRDWSLGSRCQDLLSPDSKATPVYWDFHWDSCSGYRGSRSDYSDSSWKVGCPARSDWSDSIPEQSKAREPVGGGVVLPVGGLPVFPVGGADGDVCPGAAEPEGALPPAGACCATTQVAQNRSTDNNVSLLPDIMSPPAWNFPRIPIGGRRTRWYTEVIGGVCANNRATNIRHMP